MTWTTKNGYDYLPMTNAETSIEGYLDDVIPMKYKIGNAVYQDCIVKIKSFWGGAESDFFQKLSNALSFLKTQYGAQFFKDNSGLNQITDLFKDNTACLRIPMDKDGFLNVAVDTIFYEEKIIPDPQTLKNFYRCKFKIDIDIRGILGKAKAFQPPDLKLDYTVTSVTIINDDFLDS